MARIPGRKYPSDNPEYTKKYRKEKKIKYPWIKSYHDAKYRCTAKTQSYYKKGRTFNMTTEEFKFLWFRDTASEMKRPSIDRINNKLGYFLDNCRFIELSINISIGSDHYGNRTHCNNGHEFNDKNTHYMSRGGRECRKCKRFRAREKYKRERGGIVRKWVRKNEK